MWKPTQINVIFMDYFIFAIKHLYRVCNVYSSWHATVMNLSKLSIQIQILCTVALADTWCCEFIEYIFGTVAGSIYHSWVFSILCSLHHDKIMWMRASNHTPLSQLYPGRHCGYISNRYLWRQISILVCLQVLYYIQLMCSLIVDMWTLQRQ